MFNKNYKALFLLPFFLLFCVSCEEDENFIESFSDNSIKKIEKKVNMDNFLTFESIEEMYKTIDSLSVLDDNMQQYYEENLDFMSLDRLSNIIDLENDKILEEYKNLTVEELEKYPVKFSDLHNTYSHIYLVDTLDDGSCYHNLDVYDYNLAKILNKDCLVKIDNKIYQLKKNVVKIIEDGDESKIQYLDRTLSTDSVIGITVKILGGRGTNTEVSKSAYKTNGTFRVIIYNTFSQNKVADRDYYKTTFKVSFRVLKKFLGVWYVNHKAYIHYNVRYTGNIVDGFRFRNNNTVAVESHNWSDAHVNSTIKKYHTFWFYHKSDYNANILNPEYHYNYYGHLPIIYSVQNSVVVPCNSNRTISFDFNY